MATKTKTQTPTAAYLQPILEAAALLKIRPYPSVVEQLTELLYRLAPDFPGDVLKPIDALTILDRGCTGTVEELDILKKVWPSYSGDKRYTLTATTLTWKWLSKHTGRYATIAVPFPTVLPMQITVTRYADMDEEANHSDACPVYHPEFYGEDEAGDDCNCEGFVEQRVSATVTDWNEKTEHDLGIWLERAVDGDVKPATFPREKRS